MIKYKKYLPYIILFVLSILIFNYSVNIRRGYIDNTISADNHQWLSAVSLKFAKNWYNNGAWNIKFGLYERPTSVEYSELDYRSIYPSYPSGCILPIYFISVITDSTPTLKSVYIYNLSNQYLIGLLLSIFLLSILIREKYTKEFSIFISVIPLLFIYLTPVCSYFFLRVYFADTAVILYFVIFIILEYCILENIKTKVNLYYLQSFIAGIGIFTDWLFIFLLFFTVIVRFFYFDLKLAFKSIFSLMIGPIIFASIYVWQTVHFKQLDILTSKYLQRTAQGNDDAKYKCEVDPSTFNELFWGQHIEYGYDKIGRDLILSTFFIAICIFIYNLFQKSLKRSALFAIISIVVFAIFSQIYFFKCHSIVHSFSIVKFSVLIAIIPFVISIYIIKQIPENKIQNYRHAIMLFFLILFSFYTGKLNSKMNIYYPVDNPEYNIVGDMFKKHIKYTDIVFSHNYPIQVLPPQQLSFTMKEVYYISNMTDIYNEITKVNQKFNVVLFNRDKKNEYDEDYIFNSSDDRVYENGFYITRVDKDTFIKRYHQLSDSINNLLRSESEINQNLDFLINQSHFISEQNYESFISNLRAQNNSFILNNTIDIINHKFKIIDGNKNLTLLLHCKERPTKDMKFLVHFINNKNEITYFDFTPYPTTDRWRKNKVYYYSIDISKIKNEEGQFNVALYTLEKNVYKEESKIYNFVVPSTTIQP